MKSKLFKVFLASTSLLLLTACYPTIPNGNVVGSAQFSTEFSNFSSYGDIAYLDVNGGAVATPNGIRVRLNKASFSIPAQGISLSATRFKDVIIENIPKSDFLNARMKGRSTCAYVSGFFTDGQSFQIWIYPESGQQYLYMEASAGGFYFGPLSAGKLQFGGRNLCGA